MPPVRLASLAQGRPFDAAQGRPDVALLSTEWQPRALLRAQLIEEGFEVVAADTWLMLRAHLRAQPKVVVVDLKNLPDASEILRELRTLVDPDRVLVLHALGTVGEADLKRLGVHIIERPVAISDVVAAVRGAIAG